jgi:hypothetical protein
VIELVLTVSRARSVPEHRKVGHVAVFNTRLASTTVLGHLALDELDLMFDWAGHFNLSGKALWNSSLRPKDGLLCLLPYSIPSPFSQLLAVSPLHLALFHFIVQFII